MTRLLSTGYRGKHRAEPRGRHRADRASTTERPERSERSERSGRGERTPRRRPLHDRRRPADRTRPRRRAPYAAAGLLALGGALSHGLPVAPRPAPATTVAAPEPVSIRPAAGRPALVTPRGATTRALRPTPTPRATQPARASRGGRDGRVLTGRATWYGPGFAGRRTASGEVFRPWSELTAAHRWLPFGTRLRVCRRDRCVVVRVNDRGPFGDAILDLSALAAERLGMIRAGIVRVTATVVRSAA